MEQCPKCNSELEKGFATISGNAKYMVFKCEVCDYEMMKCIGVNKN